MTTIRNPWGDGRDAAVSDESCVGRPCLNIGEDKGTFTQGRGYTSYHKNPKLVCLTRDLHGCPHPLPEFDPEEVRCCPAPRFPNPRNGRPARQKCKTCGEWADRGMVLDSRRALPELPHVACRHEDLREDTFYLDGGEKFQCRGCGLYWLSKPKPFATGKTFAELLESRR